MKTIAFDILNSDNGSLEALKAAKEFANKNRDYKLVLFGDENILKDTEKLPDNIEFIHSPTLLKKTENLREVLRQKSSLTDAIEYLKLDKADAVLSSGDSGSFLAAATLKLKRIEGVERPAFMTTIPKANSDGFFVLVDVGANVETKPSYISQWANLGAVFSQNMFSINKPKLGILNIGTEEYKGPEHLKEANKMIKQNQNEVFDYHGFVEPKDLFKDIVDVVVTDGYAGNLVLKTMETSFLTFGKLIKKTLMSSFISKIGALLIKSKMSQIKEKFDYRNVGSAYVIGLNKIIVKAHGASDKKAFLGALNHIKKGIDTNIINKMQHSLPKGNNDEQNN